MGAAQIAADYRQGDRGGLSRAGVGGIRSGGCVTAAKHLRLNLTRDYCAFSADNVAADGTVVVAAAVDDDDIAAGGAVAVVVPVVAVVVVAVDDDDNSAADNVVGFLLHHIPTWK